MTEERERNPKVDLKDIELFKGSLKLKLDSAKPIAEGIGKFGTWYIWPAFVENTKVYEGRGKNPTPKENYSGKAIFFPTEMLVEELIKICDGKINVEVEITKTAEEGQKGVYKKYLVKKLSEGTVSQTLTESEAKLLKDALDVEKTGFFKLTEEQLLAQSKSTDYKNITPEKVKEIFQVVVSRRK